MTSGKNRAVLATVAAAAGVSAPTVSKVINGRDGVSPETRQRVREALAEFGYLTPSQRRARSTGPAMVDLVIGEVGVGYAMEVLGGILELATDIRVDVVVSNITPQRMRQADADGWARRMQESGRVGLIAVTSEMTTRQLGAFRERGIPVVVIDPLNPPAEGYASVGSTNWAGGKAAADYLLSLGHERIAFLGGPPAAECNAARLHGYLAALMAHGRQAPPEYIVPGLRFDKETGAIGAARLLDLPEPPTAIFAASDSIALGVLEIVRERGLRVPDDLSLVGFDGTPLVDQTLPSLTSVSQPLREMGRVALRSVLRLADGEELDSTRIELATELVARGSTAPPAGR
jgi:LacI family transcriptional regulator